MISYQTEPRLDADEMIDLFHRSGLSERRPVDDRDLMEKMATGANLVITARHGDRLVGLARSVTDHAYCVYLSDLATDQAYQGQGIGRRLIDLTREAAGPKANLILVSSPAAMEFYARVGMTAATRAWTIRA